MLSLNFAADKLGRKKALYILWVILVGSILAECFASNWKTWIAAKFLAGAGVGMLQVRTPFPSSLTTSSFSDIDTPFFLQATIPVYIVETAATQLRGALVNTYSLWFVVGQLL